MTTGTKTISFARGAPSLDIIPVDDLRAAADAAFTKDPAGAFSYGTAVGYPPLRQWIADQHGVSVDRVIVTNGSLHACTMLFDRLVEPGDLVAIEQPLYDRSLLGLRQRGAEFLELPLLDDGFDIAVLEQALAAGRVPKFVYTIPHFHNPGGCTLSTQKRERLVQLAHEHDFLVVEDDPYRDVSFSGEPLPSMLSMDGDGRHVSYMCSFTKTVCPGLRVGYAIASEPLAKDLITTATNTYISPGMVSESILSEFIASGRLDTSIATVREALRERRDAVCDAIEQHLPGSTYVKPDGGYFVWVKLPGDVDTDELAPRAAQAGVPFAKGSDFMLAGGRDSLRLAYSSAGADDLREGVERLAGLL
jgi:DNA-binding transcriptional MocR family regulator